jgi:HEAT repeat protein
MITEKVEGEDMAVESLERSVTIEARVILRQAIPKAAEVLVKLLDAKDEKLRLRASEAVLALAGIVQVPGHIHAALDLERDKWEREAAERECRGRKEPVAESAGVGDLPCPKCARAVHPVGCTEGTCPHCSTSLRLVLLDATAKAEA